MKEKPVLNQILMYCHHLSGLVIQGLKIKELFSLTLLRLTFFFPFSWRVRQAGQFDALTGLYLCRQDFTAVLSTQCRHKAV